MHFTYIIQTMVNTNFPSFLRAIPLHLDSNRCSFWPLIWSLPTFYTILLNFQESKRGLKWSLNCVRDYCFRILFECVHGSRNVRTKTNHLNSSCNICSIGISLSHLFIIVITIHQHRNRFLYLSQGGIRASKGHYYHFDHHITKSCKRARIQCTLFIKTDRFLDFTSFYSRYL